MRRNKNLSAATERLSLSAARTGRRYVVAQVYGDDALAKRLRASGLWPGAAIEALARAPFGGPLLFRVHGFRLALRRSEAKRVDVMEAAS